MSKDPRTNIDLLIAICFMWSTIDIPNSRAESATSAPATAPTGQLIEGLVLTHLGGGVEKASVRIEAVDASEDAAPLGECSTSKTGDIHIQLSEPIKNTVRVRIKKEGYATFVQELDLSDETQQPWVDATLDGASTLTGTVNNQTSNEPIQGAHVVCSNGGQDFETDTDAQGRYNFKTIAFGPTTLTVTAKGFGTQRKMTNVKSADTDLNIELGIERTVELKIITDDEKPAPEVRVDGYVEPGGEYLTDKTGPDGKIVLRGIGPDAAAVMIRLNGPRYIHMPDYEVRIQLRKESDSNEQEMPPPTSMPAVKQELIVHVAGKVKGIITDIKSGEPIVGVRILAGREFRGDNPMTWSALDGSYELTGLPPGTNVLSFQHTSYATAIHEVQLDQDQSATLDQHMSAGHPIGGKVVDESGKPLEQVFISGDKWQGYSTLGLHAVTDKEGAFSLPNAPNGEIEFSFVKPGYGRPIRQTITAGKTDNTITLKMPSPTERNPEAPRMSKLEIGKLVPDMTLIDLNGTTYKLSELRGKYVFLDFWATWCGPCMGEVENVKALHAAMKDQPNFILIGVSLDRERDELKKTIESEQMPWPQIFGPKSGGMEAFEIFNGNGIPYTCLIGPDGKILAQELRGEQLTAAVKELIAKLQASKPSP